MSESSCSFNFSQFGHFGNQTSDSYYNERTISIRLWILIEISTSKRTKTKTLYNKPTEERGLNMSKYMYCTETDLIITHVIYTTISPREGVL